MTVDQMFREDRPQHAASTPAALVSQEGRLCEPLAGQAGPRAREPNAADPPIPWVPPPGPTGWPRVYPGL